MLWAVILIFIGKDPNLQETLIQIPLNQGKYEWRTRNSKQGGVAGVQLLFSALVCLFSNHTVEITENSP